MYLFLFLKLSNIEMDTFRAICTYLKSSFDKSSLFLPCLFQNTTMIKVTYLCQSANCSVMKRTTDIKLDILWRIGISEFTSFSFAFIWGRWESVQTAGRWRGPFGPRRGRVQRGGHVAHQKKNSSNGLGQVTFGFKKNGNSCLSLLGSVCQLQCACSPSKRVKNSCTR